METEDFYGKMRVHRVLLLPMVSETMVFVEKFTMVSETNGIRGFPKQRGSIEHKSLSKHFQIFKRNVAGNSY